MGTLRMQVIAGQPLHSGIRTVVGSIQIDDLEQRYTVDTRDFKSQTGYQRVLSPTRVKKFAQDLDNGLVDIVPAVVMNVRDFEESWLFEENGCLVLDLPDDVMLHGVDGQHRTAATLALLDAMVDRWSTFKLQFVLMLGAGEDEEMTQFHVVNSNAKSVRTDLALDLLKERAQNDPELMKSLIDKDEKWKVDAQALVEKLGLDSTMWQGRVRFAGESNVGTTIPSASMVTSVRPLMKDPFFGQLSTDSQAKVLDAYWEGIADLLPEAFAAPGDYAIQKGVGALVLNSVFPHVLAVVISRANASVTSPSSYSDVLGGAVDVLEGESQEGGTVGGSDFWRSGKAGAAGSFSSGAGKRVLGSRIINMLPAPELPTI